MVYSVSQTKLMISKLIKDSHFIKNHIPKAYSRAEQDRQDGFPNRTGESLGRRSTKSDPTATIALGPKDEIAETQKELDKHIATAAKNLRLARIKTEQLEGLSQEEGQRLKRSLTSKVSICLNCEEIITGSPGDTRRNGRCNACYQYHRRNGGRDRRTKNVSD